jgi:hypothetical protein
MANDNGRIYVDTTQTPNVGVSIEDVRTVLNYNSNDLGTLCGNSNNNVNKWAKHKPIVYPNVLAALTDTQFKEKNYGLTIPNPLTGSYTKIDDVILAAGNAYLYTRPSGLMASPFRLTDFNNYDHSVKAPINGFPATIYIPSNVTTRILNFTINQSTDYAIGLADLPSDFSSWYLAFAVKKNNVWNVKTSRYAINSGKGDYIFLNFGPTTTYDGQTYNGGVDGNVIDEGHTYECIICLCHTKINDFTQMASTQNTYKFYPAPVQDIDSMQGLISRVPVGWAARIMLKEVLRQGEPTGLVQMGLNIGYSGAVEGESYSITNVSWVVNYKYTSAATGQEVTGQTITGSVDRVTVTGEENEKSFMLHGPTESVTVIEAWGTLTYNTSQTYTLPNTILETVQQQ